MSVNPALQAFVSFVRPEGVWAQVLIQGDEHRFKLRHVADREVAESELDPVSLPDIRKLAMFTSEKQFRPLRSSPDLARGWILICNGAEDLWRGVQDLYPGSIPDWFAVRQGTPPVTHYREFTNRQTGMYRITQLLSNEQVARVTQAACHARFCLKRRLWTVEGLPADEAGGKSEIPCLEPCAILLELARKSARIEQEEKLPVQISASEMESFLAAVELVLESGETRERMGNVGAAENPRRLQLLVEKFKEIASKEPEEES